MARIERLKDLEKVTIIAVDVLYLWPCGCSLIMHNERARHLIVNEHDFMHTCSKHRDGYYV